MIGRTINKFCHYFSYRIVNYLTVFLISDWFDRTKFIIILRYNLCQFFLLNVIHEALKRSWLFLDETIFIEIGLGHMLFFHFLRSITRVEIVSVLYCLSFTILQILFFSHESWIDNWGIGYQCILIMVSKLDSREIVGVLVHPINNLLAFVRLHCTIQVHQTCIHVVLARPCNTWV